MVEALEAVRDSDVSVNVLPTRHLDGVRIEFAGSSRYSFRREHERRNFSTRIPLCRGLASLGLAPRNERAGRSSSRKPLQCSGSGRRSAFGPSVRTPPLGDGDHDATRAISGATPALWQRGELRVELTMPRSSSRIWANTLRSRSSGRTAQSSRRCFLPWERR